MNSPYQNSADLNEGTDDGISLAQVVDFLSENWKRAVLGAVVGAVIGVGGWSVLATYKAESVLINNEALTFMSWRVFQKNLPILASQSIETKQVAADQMSQYVSLTSEAWWKKNVVPTYSLSKSDAKDLAAISKDLQESGSTNILNLVVTATGSSKESALANIDVTTNFIKQGSAYLSIKYMMNGYQTLVLKTDADLQKKVLDAEVDLKFMRERAKNLEVLRQRFPQNAAVGSQQIVDLKDSSAKFMPISTQLVAINTDINVTVESLQKMRDQLAKSKVLKEFVEKAAPIVAKEPNGLALADELLKVETEMRSTVTSEDTNALQAFNEIEASLVGFRTAFSKGLVTELSPQTTKPGPLVPAAGGFFGGALAMLVYALGRSALAHMKSRQSQMA